MTPALGPKRDFPPTNFNLASFVFRPDFAYSPRPQLRDRVVASTNENRFRSALAPLLEILTDSPHDQEALTLAMIVLGESRTENVQGEESLGDADRRDRRLDPLFAVCSHCRRISWVPHNCIFFDGRAEITVNNPIGLQCFGCGYVLCRRCYAGITACPNCGSPDLRTSVYPTGRRPTQLERRSKAPAVTLVFREGPIPPDTNWLNETLGLMSPDSLEPGAVISTYPVYPWLDDIARVSMAVAANQLSERGPRTATLNNPIAAELKMPDGARVYILKLYPSP